MRKSIPGVSVFEKSNKVPINDKIKDGDGISGNDGNASLGINGCKSFAGNVGAIVKCIGKCQITSGHGGCAEIPVNDVGRRGAEE